jgi:hypothetical protein
MKGLIKKEEEREKRNLRRKIPRGWYYCDYHKKYGGTDEEIASCHDCQYI